MPEEPKIICDDIWKVFGPNPERTLREIDRSLSRSEIQQQTGHVIAVKDVSFSVQTGETFVVMGLSGSGKSTLGSLPLTSHRTDHGSSRNRWRGHHARVGVRTRFVTPSQDGDGVSAFRPLSSS